MSNDCTRGLYFFDECIYRYKVSVFYKLSFIHIYIYIYFLSAAVVGVNVYTRYLRVLNTIYCVIAYNSTERIKLSPAENLCEKKTTQHYTIIYTRILSKTHADNILSIWAYVRKYQLFWSIAACYLLYYYCLYVFYIIHLPDNIEQSFSPKTVKQWTIP